MIDEHAAKGREAALRRFKIADAGPGILDRLKSFGQGQLGAAKSLGANLRGGLGGKMNPALEGVGHLGAGMPGPMPDMGQLQRQRALGDLRTLAPTLAAGGGLYLLHRHNQAKQEAEEARQRAMMMQQGYGAPMM